MEQESEQNARIERRREQELKRSLAAVEGLLREANQRVESLFAENQQLKAALYGNGSK